MDRSTRRRKIVIEEPDDEELQRAFVTSVGEAIRHGRLEHGWTQAALAEQAGLSPNYIARLERGELGPSLYVAHRIARALGVGVSELLAAHESPPPAVRRARA